MTKKFTPEQVKKGKVDYTFDAFLNELWEDVRSTSAKKYSNKISEKGIQNGKYEKTARDIFVFVYKVCYMAATNQPELKEVLERIDSESGDVVKKTVKSNKENIAFLRAIFVREISKKLKQGLTKRQAVKATVEESKNAFANWNN
jgi:Mor family transcriptional regulator